VTLSSGARLGRYEILEPLGAGGMGEVYRARDTQLDRDVAVKVLPPALENDAHALERFEREAKAVAALSHPNILALQIVAGLAAAHERGIVHRDLKPENVFVTRDGRVKILDFGLARVIEPERADDGSTAPTVAEGTRPGTVLGTVGYMSPEQVRGHSADTRSDIFSFGALLYEMLAGRRAFRAGSAVETMNAILTEEPPEIGTSAARMMPPGLDRILREMRRLRCTGGAVEATAWEGTRLPLSEAPPDRRSRSSDAHAPAR
jgi:serine/threonine protein kinase